jgi:hypothetical protein
VLPHMTSFLLACPKVWVKELGGTESAAESNLTNTPLGNVFGVKRLGFFVRSGNANCVSWGVILSPWSRTSETVRAGG